MTREVRRDAASATHCDAASATQRDAASATQRDAASPTQCAAASATHRDAALGSFSVLLLCAALALSGCVRPPVEARERGQELFSDPAFSSSQFNAFSCATCHSAGAEEPGPRIGPSLQNSAYRLGYWGGNSARLLDAVNVCNVFFMRGEPLDSAEPRGRALFEYLASISPERGAPVRPFTVVENVKALPAGDAARGEQVWARACQGCHGAPHTGEGRLSELVSIVPETSNAYAAATGFSPSLVLIEKVRHGQFFGVGGNMPLFSREALSDEELAALVAWLGL